MKGSSVLQLSLIIIGVMSAVTGAESLVGNFEFLYGKYEIRPVDMTRIIVETLLSIGIYFLIAWLLISRSRQWSATISRFTGLNPNFSLIAKPRVIIFFLFICISIYALFRELPILIQKIFFVLAPPTSPFSSVPSSFFNWTPEWPTVICRTILPILLIVLAKPLSRYFASKMADDSPVEVRESSSDEFLNN